MENEMYTVNSRIYHSKLFERILNSDKFLDVVISVEGSIIRAHRVVLAAGSKHFERILTLNNEYSSSDPILVFPDIEFDRMKQIVQYLYTGKTLIPGNELVDFLNAAKKYEILGLCGEMDDMLSNGSIITAVRDRGAEKSFEINANENHCRNTANQIPEMTIPNVNADPKRSKRARIVLEHSDLPLAIATTSQETNALNKHDENHPEENSNGGKSHSMDKVLKVEPGNSLHDENGDDGTLKKIKCMLCKRSFRYNVAFQKHLQCKGCAIEIDID